MTKVNDAYFGSLSYNLTFLITIILFIGFLYFRKRKIEANSDLYKVKRKKAADVSRKRLKSANKYLKENNSEAFYKEILNAVWGYLSDKLSVSADILTNEKLELLLTKKNVNKETIASLLSVTELCGYAQYSPGSEEAKPQTIYNKTESVIKELEDIL